MARQKQQGKLTHHRSIHSNCQGTDQEPKQDSNKLLKFHLYPTTFLITVQGNLHSYWEQNEFQYLKSIVDADCNISTADNPLIHELHLSNDTSYTNFVSAIEAKNDLSLTNLKTFSTPRILAPSPKLNKKVDNENVFSSLQNMEDKICQISTNVETHMEKMDKQLALLNKHEDEIKDLNEKTNAVGCFDQKLCELEQHLHLGINEIKAEFKNKLQDQCIYNAKKNKKQKTIRAK